MELFKMKKLNLLLAAFLMMVSGLASAVLPAEIGTTLTALQTDGQAIFALIIPVIGVFVGFAVLIKLFKRFTSKL